MNQLEMFADPAPVVVGHAQARKSDPATSKLAAEEIESSGKAETHRQMVLASLDKLEGQTYSEIARKIGLQPVQVMRRLNDLERSNQVRKGFERKCAVALSKCCTWWLRPNATSPLEHHDG